MSSAVFSSVVSLVIHTIQLGKNGTFSILGFGVGVGGLEWEFRFEFGVGYKGWGFKG